MPGVPKARVKSRIILTPCNRKIKVQRNWQSDVQNNRQQ
jgi:hypothetical protein